jgi:tRNA G26 N,N-dimethylase Trm1
MARKNERRKECPESEKEIIIEGKAELLLSLSKNVFYNPVQEFNRDLRYILFEMCLRLCLILSKQPYRRKAVHVMILVLCSAYRV